MQAKDPTTTRMSRRAAAMRNCDTKTQSPSPVLKTDSCLSSTSSKRKSATIARMPAMRPILKYRLAPPTTTVKQPSAFETVQGLEDKARAQKRASTGQGPARRIGAGCPVEVRPIIEELRLEMSHPRRGPLIGIRRRLGSSQSLRDSFLPLFSEAIRLE